MDTNCDITKPIRILNDVYMEVRKERDFKTFSEFVKALRDEVLNSNVCAISGFHVKAEGEPTFNLFYERAYGYFFDLPHFTFQSKIIATSMIFNTLLVAIRQAIGIVEKKDGKEEVWEPEILEERHIADLGGVYYYEIGEQLVNVVNRGREAVSDWTFDYFKRGNPFPYKEFEKYFGSVMQKSSYISILKSVRHVLGTSNIENLTDLEKSFLYGVLTTQDLSILLMPFFTPVYERSEESKKAFYDAKTCILSMYSDIAILIDLYAETANIGKPDYMSQEKFVEACPLYSKVLERAIS